MAKRKKTTEANEITALMNNVAVKCGGMTTEALTASCSGLRVPYYAERYVRDSNVYITGKIEMYVGSQGSGKSSYGFHVANSFLDAGGLFFLVETENKLSPVSLKANLGIERFNSGRVQFIQAGSVDMKTDEQHLQSWQSAVSSIIKQVREAQLDELPVYILVDSMLGASGAESRKEYDEEGQSQGRSTSDMARAASITRFLANLAADLRGTNILVGFTNHGKTKIQMGGMPSFGDSKSIPGGDSIKFHCSLVLWFERGAKVKDAESAGRVVKIGCFKNSFGGEERKIEVEFRYDHIRDENGELVTDAGDYTRVVNWDWYDATTRVLKDFCDKKNYNTNISSAAARKLITLTSKGGTFTCPELGVEDVSRQELGMALEAHPEVEFIIRSFPKLGICQYPVIGHEG